jgi:alpha-tubulin suppressor-like RCC1 family protein
MRWSLPIGSALKLLRIGVTLAALLPAAPAAAQRSTVWAWGNNAWGQVGQGAADFDAHLRPEQITGLTGVTAIAAGRVHSLALRSDGTVWGWGYNASGAVGDGTTDERDAPVQADDLTDVVAIAAGEYFSLALKSDGSVWAWGMNDHGQLGRGDSDFDPHPTPLAVAGLPEIVAVSAGHAHALALDADGGVWAWGENVSGQLGDGSFDDRTAPVPVVALDDVLSISAGGRFSLALASDGTAWAWGNNDWGQLGDGSTTGREAPAPVQGLTDLVGVSAGDIHALALRADGTAWSWGANYNSQLGDGTNLDRRLPVRVVGLTEVAEVIAGEHQSMARLTDGSGWAWGWNADGLVGDRTTTNRVLPVQLGWPPVVVAMDGGTFHSLVLTKNTHLSVSRLIGGRLGHTSILAARLYELPDYVPLPNREVTFLVDGTPVGTAETDEDGKATLEYLVPESLDTGLKRLAVEFAGDALLDACRGASTLNVSPADVQYSWLSVSSLSPGQFGQTRLLAARLRRQGDHAPLAGREAVFRVQNRTVGRSITDASGQATIPYTILESLGLGDKLVTVEFQGDGTYAAARKSTTLQVVRTSTQFTVHDLRTQAGRYVGLSCRLARSPDSAGLAERRVVFKLEGATIGTVLTDGAGDATLFFGIPGSLGAGDKTLTVEFAGTTLYQPATGTGTVTIDP